MGTKSPHLPPCGSPQKQKAGLAWLANNEGSSVLNGALPIQCDDLRAAVKISQGL
jgi:hypothetical protein